MASSINWSLVNDLIERRALSPCEAADLSHMAVILDEMYNDAELVKNHIIIRAELLSLGGSDVQELWDSMNKEMRT